MTHEEISSDVVALYKMIREGKRRAREEGLKPLAQQLYEEFAKELKPCVADEENHGFNETVFRCLTHENQPMDHLDTDGDTLCCKTWADRYGCNKCPAGAHGEFTDIAAVPKETGTLTYEDGIKNYRDLIPEVSLGGQIQVHGRIFELTFISYGKSATLHFREKL